MSTLGIERIGIGVPGPLNKKGDLILNLPNLKYLFDPEIIVISKKYVKIKKAAFGDLGGAVGAALLTDD